MTRHSGLLHAADRWRPRTLAAALVTAVLAATAVVLPGAAPASADTGQDIATITSRLQEYFLEQGDAVQIANGIDLAKTSDALDYVAAQAPDGSWPDVDYRDRTSSANGKTWDAYKALYRMVAIAQAYQDESSPAHHDPRLVQAEERALTYWDGVDPGNTNWWETEIGESIAMGRISVFLGDVLSPETAALAIDHNQGKLDPAGANGAWRTSDHLYKALATRDVDAIRAGFATMVQTVAVDDSGTVQEAVQPDGTFWAHGAQLYSEGYGMALFTMVAMWADAARGTSLAFTRAQLDTVAFYVVDGTRWLIRGEIEMLYLQYRPATTVDGVTSYAAVFLDPLDRMARTDALYARDYRELADNIRGETPGNGETGDRYFWRSEFSSHQRADYGIVTGLNSSRTVGSEYRSTLRPDVGNEIVWNRTGTTAIQVTNREYTALGPAFDWYHYPGTTVPYVKETTLGKDGRSGNAGSFTGGLSDGRYGATVQTLDRAGTQATKSTFLFDDEMVALGTGIRSTSTAPVVTTVNQVAAADNASVDGRPVAEGTDGAVVADPRWAYNDRVGYVFPDDQSVTVSDRVQTGSYPGEQPEHHRAYTLSFDHGVHPQDAGYEYIVLPAATAAQTAAYAAAPRVEVLRNDDAVQAVRHPGLHRTMAVFTEPGSLDLGGGRTLRADQPAIVELDESTGSPVVSVANPDRPGLVVDVTLEGAGETESGTFVLGAGAWQGKTVTAPLVAQVGPASPWSASSAVEGHPAASVGDGDQGSDWQSVGSGGWLQERLAAGSWVSGLDVDWGDAHATRFLVQTSTDGRTWTDQRFVQGGSGGHSAVTFPAVPATFLRLVPLAGTGPGGSVSVREAAARSSVDLALGAPTTASDGTTPGNATDGNTETRWIADRTGQPDASWLQVDLGSVQHVGTVRMRWEASFADRYRIQVSDDGTAWRNATTAETTSDGGVDVVPVDATGRYVRMQTVHRALSSYGVSLFDFQVFGDGSVASAPAADSRVDLAEGRPTTADSVYRGQASVQASMATDGSSTTKWSSDRPTGSAPWTDEHWLQVDLGSVRSVSQAVVDWEAGNSLDYRVEGSTDGTTWTQLAHVHQTGTADHRRDTVDLPSTEVRFVRVIGTPATKYGLNIWSFEVYGGYQLTCGADVRAPAASTAVLGATLAPVDPSDSVTADSLDPAVAAVTGATLGPDGAVSVALRTGTSGSTSVVVSHEHGDEYVRCPVVVTVDSAALRALVDRADGLDSTAWTAVSWAPLLPALEAAKTTLRDTTATQADVDGRTADLRRAVDGLVAVPTPALRVTGSPAAGGRVVVHGIGFPAGGAFVVELHSDPVRLGTVTAGDDGAFTLPVRIPTATPAGPHAVVALQDGAELAAVTVQVTRPAAGGGSGGDPGTGTGPGVGSGTGAGTGPGGATGGGTGSGAGASTDGPGGGSATEDGAGAGTARSGLAWTGSDGTAAAIAVALVLVFAGAALVVARRRRTGGRER